jgi:capsular polysaccharide biosynthesis protein
VNDEDKVLNGDAGTAFVSVQSHDLPWDFDDDTGAGADLAADAAVGLNLVSLPYIGQALRRMAWLWCGLALLGLVIGIGSYKAFPPSYQAASSVLLTNNPQIDPVDAEETNIVLAQSQSVATLALHQLGLNESVSDFQKNYTITSPTDQILLITVSSASSSDAVRKAGALASAFLTFRTNLLESQQAAVLTGLNNQLSQTEQQITSLAQQISQVSAEPTSSQNDATLAKLQEQRTQAQTSVVTLQQTISDTQATSQATTQSMVQGTRLLNAAAPVAHSRLKLALVYVIGGLIVGLVLGMGFIVIQAIVSDKLRRRDDIAQALGAPVRLSTGAVRISRWRPGRRASSAAGNRDVKRIAGYLGNVLAGIAGPGSAATLAVVSVDNDDAAAVALLVLARSLVRDGKQVIVSDLSDGARFARLVGAKHDGVQKGQVDGGALAVAVPDRDSIAPAGPVGGGRRRPLAAASDTLATAYASADLMCTLVDLDPTLGGEHLATWASDAVVLVTAGKSSATRIHGVGELVRLSGTNLLSAVVIGADKTDESLGFDEQAPLAGAR